MACPIDRVQANWRNGKSTSHPRQGRGRGQMLPAPPRNVRQKGIFTDSFPHRGTVQPVCGRYRRRRSLGAGQLRQSKVTRHKRIKGYQWYVLECCVFLMSTND